MSFLAISAKQWPRPKRGVAIKAVFGAVLAVTATFAGANEANYPVKPVRMIVSYAAGNVTDTLARIVSEGLSAKWGQPVTVENRPGSGGSLGAQMAAKTAPDGYTLLVSAMAAMAINPHVYASVGYDVNKDFVPIVSMAYPEMIMVVTPGLKIDSLAKLIEFSKANPTTLNYGTAGNGTVPHLNMEQLKSRSGLLAQHVPYKAAAAVLTDLIGGRVQVQQEAVSVLLPQVKAGKVVPIAVGSQARSRHLPDVPTLSELYPGFEPVVPWLGIFAPLGTPQAIVEKINVDVREILARPAIQKQLADNGMTVSGGPQKDFEVTVRKDYDRLGALVKKMNLKVD